ncbi:MAG: hypothetical protein KDD40_00790, partial [Bdellovibrionales bacterium]|nr:hypothetical protein [Bdellovibrionales bacterium]
MKLISVVFVLLLYFPLCASEPPKTTECLSLLDTQAKFQSYLDEISVSDWTFYLGKDPGQEQRLYLQARFKDYDSYSQSVIEERSGKRYLSVYMTKNEVIQQALSLALVAIEHQVRKNFFYKKQRIFGPHFNVDMLTEAKQSSSIDVSANNNAEESIDIWIANIETPYVSIT